MTEKKKQVQLHCLLDPDLKQALEIHLGYRKILAAEEGGDRVSERTIVEEALRAHPGVRRELRRMQIPKSKRPLAAA